MNLSIAVWKDYSESPNKFLEMVNNHSGLTFETIMNGGFGTASFTVPVWGWNAVRWYRDYVGHHIVIFDDYGRRLYEGYIDTTDASPEGVAVNVVGYYAHASDLTDGIIYPWTTPASISDVVSDAIYLSEKWRKDLTHVKTLVTDISPQDFTGEAKLVDAIESVLKFGDDGADPVPLYFAIWEYRMPYLFPEPRVSEEPSWYVSTSNFSGSQGQTLSRTRKDLFNKIQVLYDDPDIGATFTDWFEDGVSQGLFGTREGSLNIGGALPDIADVMGELAILSYAWPVQSSSLSITGRIQSKSGYLDYPYMIRAGQAIKVKDYDPSASMLVDGAGGVDAAQAFISRTTYSVDKNTTSLELGRKNLHMDILMARLGMGGADVR